MTEQTQSFKILRNADPEALALEVSAHLSIALIPGTQEAVALDLGLARTTVYGYQRQFRKERIAAGLSESDICKPEQP